MDKPCEKRCKRITKITIFLLLCVLLSIFIAVSAAFQINIVSYAAAGGSASIVIERDSKRILSGSNYNENLPIASTTKILTALTVIDNVEDLDKKISVPKKAVGVEGSSIYLVEGEKLSYLELLYGLMLRSGNDAAVALAIATSGDVDSFIVKMNEKARECGANECNFTNPHGLHDDNHLCSAKDLAYITAVALTRPIFAEIVSTKFIKISGDPVRYLTNKNKMLRNFEGADGVKTGYTVKSGRCLVTSATKNGMQLISVVLNHPDMWNDAGAMLNSAFAKYTMIEIIDGSPRLIDVEKGAYKKVWAQSESFKYPLSDEEYERLKIIENIPRLTAPVKCGENVGSVEVYLDNQLLFSNNIYTIANIKRKGIFK